MKLRNEMLKQWGFVKLEFSKAFATQIAKEITEIEDKRDARMILKTLRAKAKTVARKTALRIFFRAISALL
jgi:hypothetical protein